MSDSAPAPASEPTVYRDNAIERSFIALFSYTIARNIGVKHYKPGYDGFVDLSKKIVRGRTAAEQQAVVGKVLRSLVPAPVLWFIRTAFSPTQLVCELNAWFATKMFVWLVGACEVKTTIVTDETGETREQASCVKIKKCRYLEASHCVGACVNICKVPTQEFFTQEFGIPVTMTPNFEDYSCEMVFGQMATPIEDDASIQNQPCLIDQCSMAVATLETCPSLSDSPRPPVQNSTTPGPSQRQHGRP
jgi:Beta-carotene isomerase D27-like, C-terminal